MTLNALGDADDERLPLRNLRLQIVNLCELFGVLLLQSCDLSLLFLHPFDENRGDSIVLNPFNLAVGAVVLSATV